MLTNQVKGQTERALWRRSAWNIWLSCPAFQGHSRSSKQTWIRHLWLPVNVL